MQCKIKMYSSLINEKKTSVSFSFLSYTVLLFLFCSFSYSVLPFVPFCTSFLYLSYRSFFTHFSLYLFLSSLFLSRHLVSLFLEILFPLFGLRNYDPGFALVTPLYPSLSLSHASGISVAVLVSLPVSLIRVLSLSFFLSLQFCLPLALYISRYYCIPTVRISEMKSTLLLAPTIHRVIRPSSLFLLFLLSHLPPLLKAWRGCYADRNSI